MPKPPAEKTMQSPKKVAPAPPTVVAASGGSAKRPNGSGNGRASPVRASAPKPPDEEDEEEEDESIPSDSDYEDDASQDSESGNESNVTDSDSDAELEGGHPLLNGANARLMSITGGEFAAAYEAQVRDMEAAKASGRLTGGQYTFQRTLLDLEFRELEHARGLAGGKVKKA